MRASDSDYRFVHYSNLFLSLGSLCYRHSPLNLIAISPRTCDKSTYRNTWRSIATSYVFFFCLLKSCPRQIQEGPPAPRVALVNSQLKNASRKLNHWRTGLIRALQYNVNGSICLAVHLLAKLAQHFGLEDEVSTVWRTSHNVLLILTL